MHEWLVSASEWLVHFVHQFGYAGIFIMTFLESTFFPLPAEVTMVPAGYLVQQGQMHYGGVFASAVVGTLAGSWFNYWLAKHYGRRFLTAYGKYVLFPPEKLDAIERYFRSHGDVSIFTGRLIPGLRHFISFPAGLAGMNIPRFLIFTGAGGGIWMLVLITLGYEIGDNKELLHHYLPRLTYGAVALVVAIVCIYIYTHRRKRPKE